MVVGITELIEQIINFFSGSLPEVRGSARPPLRHLPRPECFQLSPPQYPMPPQPNCRQPSLSSAEMLPDAAFAFGNMKGSVSDCILVWLSCRLFQATSQRSLPPLKRSKIHARRPIASSRMKNTFASDDRSPYVPWWGFPLPAVCDSKLMHLAISGWTSVPVRRRPSTEF